MTTDNRPKVFVSSTIYDFRDLRSALKYWLEEMGYQVLFSEFSDFPQSPDQNSYDSCLASIDQCQYFILLVGNRVGGLMPDGISITRAEYRRAYENLKQGTLKLIPFVRSEIWTIREDRKALGKHLDTVEKRLSQPTKKRIKNFKSPLVDEPGHIFDFLGEIARNTEMKNAGSSGVLPIGNWIYQFDTFRDIIDTLNVQIRAGTPMRKAVLNENLRHEFLLNTTHLYRKHNNSYTPLTAVLHDIFKRYPDNPEIRQHKIDKSEALIINVFLVLTARLRPLSSVALREALLSGDFMEYDNTTHRFKSGLIHSALLEISYRHDTLSSPEIQTLAENFSRHLVPLQRDDKTVSIPATDIRYAWNYCGTINELIFLYKNVIDAIEGNDSVLRNTRFTLPMPSTLKDAAERHPPISFIEELFERPWDQISQ